MKTFKSVKTLMVLVVGIVLAGYITSATAAAGNDKRGRVYFKMVCTVCHMTQAGKAMPPASKTMDEWRAYFAADKHDATGSSNGSVKYHISQEYRNSIQDKNKAAKKFVKMPDDVLYADVLAFVVKGAKDSDTPATCE